MYLAYFDETGDDGFPKYSSELFLLTSIYQHHQNWKNNYGDIVDFRKRLKDSYGFPVNLELHTSKLMLNKRPYRSFNWCESRRLSIANEFAALIKTLNMKCINVCIYKAKILTPEQRDYYKQILDRAFSFNIQRIENSIKNVDSDAKFLIITDEGRVSSMRKTSRKIQKINFIPSKYSPESRNKTIDLLIEDPLPKDSKDSYFIQIADYISYFVYLYLIGKDKWHGRLSWLSYSAVEAIVEEITPIFNLEATRNSKYGFVCYPR